MPDAHANFALTSVTVAPSPATTGTTLTVASGSVLPAVPFNATVYPPSLVPLSTNAEIIRVTVNSSGALTIVRAQESTTAIAIAVNYNLAATITAKTLTDVENQAFWSEQYFTSATSYTVASVASNVSLGVYVTGGPNIVTIPAPTGSQKLIRVWDAVPGGLTAATTITPSSGSIQGSAAGKNILQVKYDTITLFDSAGNGTPIWVPVP